MIKNRLPIFIAAVVACSPVLAQGPTDKPLTEAELLKQIESLKPLKDGAVPPPPPVTPVPAPQAGALANPISLFNSPGTSGDMIKPQTNRTTLPGSSPGAGGNQPGDPNQKPPTEITALEATLDQRANVAVFVGGVIVKDPQFNVDCDKLTAYLKHDEKDPKAPAPKVATPRPATPAPGTAAKKQSGGLEKAIAVTTSERRVVITQDKVEADGSITHGIGLADRAEYFATSGDIFLYGMPDVTQGTNRCIATAPETWMKMNRDGRMEAHGPHRTLIIDNSDRDNKSASQ